MMKRLFNDWCWETGQLCVKEHPWLIYVNVWQKPGGSEVKASAMDVLLHIVDQFPSTNR